MSVKNVVIINAHSGRARRGRELNKLLAAINDLPNVTPYLLHKGEDPTEYARQLVRQGVEIIGAAGGDGTVSAVANALVGSSVKLVAIPFGTLNHFARDLGMPPQPQDAVRLMLPEEGSEQSIDVGQVNERYFINNSSIGLYPRLVKLRERHEAKLGKGLAYVLATIAALRYPVHRSIQLPVEDEMQPFKVWLVFAANNRINMKLPRPGSRDSLSEGQLDLYIIRASNRIKLFGAAMRFLLNQPEKSDLISEHCLTDFEVSTQSHRRVSVAFDGEVFRMRPPLKYQIVPNALKVRVPAQTSGD